MWRMLLLVLAIILSACSPELPNRASLAVGTPNPNFQSSPPTQQLPESTQEKTSSDSEANCTPEIIKKARESLPEYQATSGSFIKLTNNRFTQEGSPYPVYGVNYYPRDTPFWRFLTETSLDVMGAELDILKRSGLNTLRLFIRYQDIFICETDGAVPYTPNLLRLDSMLTLLAEKGFRAILVLHHDPNVSRLYAPESHYLAQTRFLVSRYRQEPAILAWDIRDKGDQDYLNGTLSAQIVLSWVAEITFLIRQIDQNHLITASWWKESHATAPFVDFVSFQHYGEYDPLRQTIALLRNQTDKPLLLSAVGYSTYTLDETTQRNLLYQAFGEINTNQALGWVAYMAFDYPTTSTCITDPCTVSEINRYGLWNTSYFPKLALEAIERITQNK